MQHMGLDIKFTRYYRPKKGFTTYYKTEVMDKGRVWISIFKDPAGYRVSRNWDNAFGGGSVELGVVREFDKEGHFTIDKADLPKLKAFLGKRCRFLHPSHFLLKHQRETRRGRVYWTTKDKRTFCKTYLGLDYATLDKQQLHIFMCHKKGGLLFDKHGLPIWEYTETPVRWEFNS